MKSNETRRKDQASQGILSVCILSGVFALSPSSQGDGSDRAQDQANRGQPHHQSALDTLDDAAFTEAETTTLASGVAALSPRARSLPPLEPSAATCPAALTAHPRVGEVLYRVAPKRDPSA